MSEIFESVQRRELIEQDIDIFLTRVQNMPVEDRKWETDRFIEKLSKQDIQYVVEIYRVLYAKTNTSELEQRRTRSLITELFERVSQIAGDNILSGI